MMQFSDEVPLEQSLGLIESRDKPVMIADLIDQLLALRRLGEPIANFRVKGEWLLAKYVQIALERSCHDFPMVSRWGGDENTIQPLLGEHRFIVRVGLDACI